MDQRFSRHERLQLKRDFDRCFREGRAFHFPEITVRALPNGLPSSRLGLSVGRRHGGAVRRNRIKRLLREAWRLNKGALSAHCDVVFVPRAEWRDLRLAGIEPTVRKVLQRIEEAFGSR